MSRRAILSSGLFVIILAFIAQTYYHDNVHMKPRGIHAWAQADRLALAIGFYDNGMNFFKPRTYNQSSIDGITGVEFPLPAYLAALAGKIFGRGHISMLFRLISTIIGCTGLLFLFMAVLRLK